jgi:drug/metabolite transporter (DMT)-like permease
MPSTRPILGICLMAFAMFIYTLTNAFLRFCDQAYSPLQVLSFRYGFALIPCLVLGGRLLFIQRQISLKTYALRGIASAASLGSLFASIYLLPYADATVLMFISMLFLVILSQPILKEHVSRVQWVAVGLGFCGVIILASPTGQINTLGIALGVFSAFVEALLLLNGRLLTRKDSSTTIVFYSTLFGFVVSLIGLPFVWKTPSLKDFLMLSLLGLGGGLGHVMQTAASKYATSGVIGPAIYTAMIWGVVIGSLIFHEPLTHELLLGGGLIISTGLWVIWSERHNKKNKSAFDVMH